MKKIFSFLLTISVLFNAFPMQQTTTNQQPTTTTHTQAKTYEELRKLKSLGYFKKGSKGRTTELLKKKIAAKKTASKVHKKQTATAINLRKCNWTLLFALFLSGSLMYSVCSNVYTAHKNPPVITHMQANGVKQECTLTDNTFFNCKWTNATTGQELYSGNFTMNFNGTCNPNMPYNAANSTDILTEIRSANVSDENPIQPILPHTFPKAYRIMQELYNRTNHTTPLKTFVTSDFDNVASIHYLSEPKMYTGKHSNLTDDAMIAGIWGHEMAHLLQKIDRYGPIKILMAMLSPTIFLQIFYKMKKLIIDSSIITNGRLKRILTAFFDGGFFTLVILYTFIPVDFIFNCLFFNYSNEFFRRFFDFELNADLVSASITEHGAALAHCFSDFANSSSSIINWILVPFDTHPPLNFRCAALQEFAEKYATLMAQAAQAILQKLAH